MNERAAPEAVQDLPVHVTPVVSPFASGWYAGEVEAPEPRSALVVDLDVDVCVVGSGLAGLTVAREVARRGWSVVVLEAGRIGGAASGRNTGFVLPGFGEDLDRIIERVGVDHARELWKLSQAGADYVRRSAQELRVESGEPQRGWLHVAKTDRGGEMNALAERVASFGSSAEYWTTPTVRGLLPSDHYFGGVYFPAAFAVNPLRYTLALARAAEDAGARIFETTPAVSIDPAGVRKRIGTPSALVRAAHVVLAGNVDLGALFSRIAATLTPVTTYVMVTEPIGPVLRETIRFRGAVSDGERADNHYRIVGDDRLMWAGRATVAERDARRFARGLAGDIARVFPQIGKVQPAHVWSGTLGLPIHRMPQIGELYRGLWVASGFGGHGLNTTAMAGELIARGIVENDATWRLFAPYELVWAGGKIGRAVMGSLLFGRRPVELAAAAWARFRERAMERQAKQKKKRAERKAQREAERAAAARVAAYQAAAEQVAVTAPVVEPAPVVAAAPEPVAVEPVAAEPVVAPEKSAANVAAKPSRKPRAAKSTGKRGKKAPPRP